MKLWDQGYEQHECPDGACTKGTIRALLCEPCQGALAAKNIALLASQENPSGFAAARRVVELEAQAQAARSLRRESA